MSPSVNNEKSPYIVHPTTIPTAIFRGSIRPALKMFPGIPSGIPESIWAAPVIKEYPLAKP